MFQCGKRKFVYFVITALYTLSSAESLYDQNDPEPLVSRNSPSEDIDSLIIPTAYSSDIGDWYATDTSNGETCIRLHGSLQFRTQVINENETKIDLNLKVPQDAATEGSCDEDLEYIDINWVWNPPDSKSSWNISTSLAFEKKLKNIPDGKYVLSSMILNILSEEDNISSSMYIDNLGGFPTTLNHSYKCSDDVTIGGEFKLTLSDFQLEAFNIFDIPISEFSHAESCPHVNKGNAFALMILTLLGCLIVFFTLAYLIFCILRNKFPQFGYHTVS